DLPTTPAHGRTLHRLADRPERSLPQTALPGRDRQRLVAPHPHGRPQPPPTDQPPTQPPIRSLATPPTRWTTAAGKPHILTLVGGDHVVDPSRSDLHPAQNGIVGTRPSLNALCSGHS